MPDTNYKLCEWCEEAEGSLCQKCGFRYVCYDCLKHNPLEPTEPLCPACKRDLVKGVEIARSIVEHHSKRLGFQKPIWLPLEKENKMTGKTFDRMRDWRNFAEHMSAYIKENVLKKYQADGKDERVDLMHFQTAKAAAWNCLKYGLRIFNGAGKRHDWEKIAHYAEIGYHLEAQEAERKEEGEKRKDVSLTFRCNKCSHSIEYKTFGCLADPSRLPTTCPGCKQDGITWKQSSPHDRCPKCGYLIESPPPRDICPMCQNKLLPPDGEALRHEIDHIETIEKHEAAWLEKDMKGSFGAGDSVRHITTGKLMVLTSQPPQFPTNWICRFSNSKGDFEYSEFTPQELVKTNPLDPTSRQLEPEDIMIGSIYRHRLDGHALLVLKSARMSGKDGSFTCRFRYDPEEEDGGYGHRTFQALELRLETSRERNMREKYGKQGSAEV